jgi:YggT family protein
MLVLPTRACAEARALISAVALRLYGAGSRDLAGMGLTEIVAFIGERKVLHSIFSLIVDTAASVLGGVLLLRFWMQVVRIRPPASIAQFTFQLSDWLVRPLRRVLPGVGGYDWASLVGAFLVALLSIVVDIWIVPQLSVQAILLLSILRVVRWILYGLIGFILIEVIFSWVNPHAPLAPFVRALNDPVMRPLRRIIPPIGNIDLSPLVALVLLQIALQLLSTIIISPLLA